jgi:hypothetical protein
MTQDLPNPTQSLKDTFNDWHEELSQAVCPEAFPLNKRNLLQCPASIRLRSHGFDPDSEPFKFWGNEGIVNFKKTRFLKMNKVTKSNHVEKPLPLVRSYSDGNYSNKGEEFALTFLYEKSGGERIVSPEGEIVDNGGIYSRRPTILAEDAYDSGKFRSNPSIQQNIKPLGKKGMISFHTGMQYCNLSEIPTGIFQRFFISPSPEASITRAIHTLRKLAGSDPKSIPEANRKAQYLYSLSLRDFGITIRDSIENVLEMGFTDNVKNQAEEIISSAPDFVLGNIRISLCPELVYGYTYQGSAISIKLTRGDMTFEELQESCAHSWDTLMETKIPEEKVPVSKAKKIKRSLGD